MYLPVYGLYGIDVGYYVVALVALALGLVAESLIKHTYARWSRVPAGIGGTGADVARRMLDSEGASQVCIGHASGFLSDHYDPRDNSLHLSADNFSGGSVASVAVACHEAGHAVQRSCGFAFYRLRCALVPVVNLAQSSWTIVLLGGVLLNLAGLVRLAIALFAFSVLFNVVTLPVEIDASRRGLAFLRDNGCQVDERGARQVLVAAALTYVAAALSSLLQLLYLVSRYGGRSDD